jgi:hypothetical protein
MPRHRPVSYVYTDTPEIQALGAGFARQGYFNQGYGDAQGEANTFTIRSTAVPKGKNPQFAFLTPQYGKFGEAGGPFVSPVSVKKVLALTGLSTPYQLDKMFNQGKTGLGLVHGYTHSKVQGPTGPAMELLRAFRTL